jgi:hypothetical protein
MMNWPLLEVTHLIILHLGVHNSYGMQAIWSFDRDELMPAFAFFVVKYYIAVRWHCCYVDFFNTTLCI